MVYLRIKQTGHDTDMSMSGLRRPQYTALAVVAVVGVAFVAYRNYQQAQPKSLGTGLHRSNAVRRLPRRRHSRNSENSQLQIAVDLVQEIISSNQVVGQYQNDLLLPHFENPNELNLDLANTNLAAIPSELIDRDGWSRHAQQALTEHIQGQYVQSIVKQLCSNGSHLSENIVLALSLVFKEAGISRRVARNTIDLVNNGGSLTGEWSPRSGPRSGSMEAEGGQFDGTLDPSDRHPSPSDYGEDDGDEQARFPHGEFDDSGASPNMLSILYSISGEQARRDGYIHRSIECNSCGTCPIQGIRYHCANCFDYDLCETCEANQLHVKNHVFYKIRIPAPSRGQIKQVLPKWYPGNPTSFPQNISKSVSDRLKEETGMDITEIEALYDQFKCLGGAQYANDPCELGMALNRQAFDLYFLPSTSEKPSPSNLIYDRIFSFYDRNDDGLIGFEEFLKGLAELQDKSRMARLKRIFLGYDLDADGFVCRKDFLRMFRAYYDLSRQLNREMIANQEELGFLDEEIREVVQGSQPISAAFGGSAFFAHQSRTGVDKQETSNGDLLIANGPNEVLQNDRDMHGDRARAVGNAAVGHRPRSHPFRSFRVEPPQDEPLMQLPMPNNFELLGIQHADDATEADLNGPDPPHQAYGWPPLLAPEPEDIISALGVELSVEEINDPLDRSRVIYAQSQRLDAESDRFLTWTRQKAVHDRWKRKQFYLDEEEGMAKPQGYTEPNSSDEESETPEPKTTSSSRRQSLRSRSSSKVRFDDSAIDTDYETRSNASSRSIPQNERWGGYELSRAEIDVGQDILYQAVQQGFNELLDSLFKEKEDEAMDAEASRKARQEWEDVFEQHKQAVAEDVETVEKALIDADMQRTEELLKGHSSPSGSPKTPFDGPQSEHSDDGLSERPDEPSDPENLVQQMFGSQIEVGIAQALNELRLAAALTDVEKTLASGTTDLDPTLPQNMPNEWDLSDNSSSKRSPPPTKETLEKWVRDEATERESEDRGGPGKLTFEEFRWKMRKEDEVAKALGDENDADTDDYWEKSADLGKLSFVGTWLEMASF